MTEETGVIGSRQAVADRKTGSQGPGDGRRAPKSRQGKFNAKAISRRNLRNGLIFISPNFIGFICLTLLPTLTLFYIAFTKWSAFGKPVFNGVKNWVRLSHDKIFMTSVWNTFYYSIVHIPLTLILAFALAVLLNSKLRGRAFFRTVAFFPYITSLVAAAQVWGMLFDPKSGPINSFLRLFISNPPGWLGSTAWAMPAVIIVGTWREVGYYMILLLAGLQTIPSELYEAAELDGTSGWQRFWHVTVPMMRPTLFFVMITLTGRLPGSFGHLHGGHADSVLVQQPEGGLRPCPPTQCLRPLPRLSLRRFPGTGRRPLRPRSPGPSSGICPWSSSRPSSFCPSSGWCFPH